MILYHGTFVRFDEPKVSFGKKYRDFGVGFYLAENVNDSLSISVKRGGDGYLYTYSIDEDAAFEQFRIKEFSDGFDDAWGRFVYQNRIDSSPHPYDIVIGQTAGGQVNDLFDKWRRENSKYEDVSSQLLMALSDTTFGIQWCLCNQDAVKLLTLEDIEPIERD